MGVKDSAIAKVLGIEVQPPYSGDDKARIDGLRQFMTDRKIVNPQTAFTQMQSEAGQGSGQVNMGSTDKVDRINQSNRSAAQDDLQKAMMAGALKAARQDMAQAQGEQLYHAAKQQFILTGHMDGVPSIIQDLVRGVQAQAVDTVAVDWMFEPDGGGLSLMPEELPTASLDVKLLQPTHSPEVLALKAGSN